MSHIGEVNPFPALMLMTLLLGPTLYLFALSFDRILDEEYTLAFIGCFVASFGLLLTAVLFAAFLSS